MNFSYFKKSKYTLEETTTNFKKELENSKIKILSETQIESGSYITFIHTEKLQNLIKEDKSVFGMFPNSALIFVQDNKVLAGILNPEVLGKVTNNPNIYEISQNLNETLKNAINIATGSEKSKVSGIKLYSTQTCPYCVMEKQWLDKNNVKHKVIYVDKDQKAAQQMVEKTGQMGVPVTEIQYEDDDSEIIVGFDKIGLSKILGI